MKQFLATSLVKRPYSSNIVIGMCLMGIGDVGAQYIEQKPKIFKFDKTRSLTMISYIGILFAPFNVAVFSAINRRMLGTSLLDANKRALLSNLLTNPAGNLMFFSYSTFIETSIQNSSINLTETKTKIEKKVEDKYFITCVNSFMLWVPLNTLNNWLVPPTQRVVCAFFIAAIWNCYLSLAQHES